MSDTSSEMSADSSPTSRRSLLIRVTLLLLVISVAAAGYVTFGDELSLERLAERETQLREFQKNRPVVVYGLAFLVYVSVTGMSLPGATVLSLVFAWYFGFVGGLILVSLSSTTGAAMAFLMSRYLLGNTIQEKFGQKLAAFNEALDREGAFYLFSLRLIPAVPFFVINVVMGLTKIRLVTFWWVSQLGMLPGTAAYVYAGSSVLDLETLADRGLRGIVSPELVAAFVILGLFPIVVRKVMSRIRGQRNQQAS